MVALTLSIVLPLGVLSVVSIQRTWRRQLANVDRQNIATARAISVAIDTQIETTTAALDVFGALHALDVPDLAAFDSLARRLIVRQPNWSALLLADLHGRVIAAAPEGDVDDRRFVRNRLGAGGRRDARSRWCRSCSRCRACGGHFVMIAVPIVRDGKVKLALGARVRSDSLGRCSAPAAGAAQRRGRRWSTSGYRIVARTKQEESYVGTTVNQCLHRSDFAHPGGQLDHRHARRHTGVRGLQPFGAHRDDRRSGAAARGSGWPDPPHPVDPRRRLGGDPRRSGTAIGLAFGQVIVRAMRGGFAVGDGAGARRGGLARAVAHHRDRRAVDRPAAGRGNARRSRNRERDEASRLKDEFLMTVSHELRTPLTAIYGWARMLSTGQIRDAQRPRAIDAIERNAAALQQLVNDLLDVSRVVSGRLRLDVQPVALPDVVAAAIDAIRPAAHAKNIAVVTNMDEGELRRVGRRRPPAAGDLEPAVQRRPLHAGGRIASTSRCRAPAPASRSSCATPDPASTPRFCRTPSSASARAPPARRARTAASGSGWRSSGTSSSCTAARSRRSNNTPAPGATFRIVLPARSAAAPATPRRRAGGRAASPVRGRRFGVDGVRVLVTDDDMNARELLAVILENAGAEVRAAASAEDALMILQTWTPDVVLSDIEMPGEDGYGLIEKARRLTASRGTAGRDRADRARAAGRSRARAREPASSGTWPSRSSRPSCSR